MTGEPVPPPLPAPRRPSSKWSGRNAGIAAAVFGACIFLCFCVVVALRVYGLIEVYKMPSASMAPAINRDDNILVEGITYRYKQPARGDLIVFKGDELPRTKPGERYIKRLVGLPGDHLRISDSTLYINDEPALFRNKEGEIHYATGLGPYLRREGETFTVPDGSYFVLGDNSPNSADSRMWGAIRTSLVTGRAVFCYFPSQNVGWLR